MPCSMDPNEVRFFSGRSHPQLAADITGYLGVPLDATHFSRFSNDNLRVQLGASVRHRAVYIVQSLVPPVSDHLLELFMMLDAAQTAAAREVNAIIPYFSYARSDKKDAPRIPITARLIADLLKTAGATHVMTMTLHSPQVHGFFSVPTDPLTARSLFVAHFQGRGYRREDTVVVAPDFGRAGSASRLANKLALPSLSADKNRISDTEVAISEQICRQVEGFRRALVYDDEIATGGSVGELSRLLVKGGVQEVILVCTHGVFTGRSLERLAAIPQVSEIVATDTVPISPARRVSKLTVLPVGSVFGEAIWRNHSRQSIGDLFAFGEECVRA